jgi:hypothetical protein
MLESMSTAVPAARRETLANAEDEEWCHIMLPITNGEKVIGWMTICGIPLSGHPPLCTAWSGGRCVTCGRPTCPNCEEFG